MYKIPMALMLSVLAMTQLINISYFQGLESDFSNMVLQAFDGNGSYEANYSIVSKEDGRWALVNVTNASSFNVLARGAGTYSTEKDPRIMDISFFSGLEPDFSNLVINIVRVDGTSFQTGFSIISKEDGKWATIGLEKEPLAGQTIDMLASHDTIKSPSSQDGIADIPVPSGQQIDSAGPSEPYEIDIRGHDGKNVLSESNGRKTGGKHQVTIVPQGTPIKKMVFQDLSGNGSLRLDDVPVDSVPSDGASWLTVYAIDPTSLNFTSATVSVIATGNSLFKCKSWDFASRNCAGGWVLIRTDLVPGKEYSFELTPEDPSFGEKNITIIDVQSYPEVGGNWTVRFTTIGTANLTIRTVNGTTWDDSDPGADLNFVDLRCGNITMSPVWDDVLKTVLYENYFCADTGYETSKVLAPGEHHLEFQFGDDFGYANNDATNISSCSNITSSGAYALTTSLIGYPNAGVCIRINASDVVFDCMSFNLTGNDTSSSTAILVTNANNVTVRNCNITNYSSSGSTAIKVLNSSRCLVENNLLYSNSYGVYIMNNGNMPDLSKYNVVRNNTACQNGLDGITFYGRNVSYNNITSNYVCRNRYGISFVNTYDNRFNYFFNNTAYNDSSYGFYFTSGSDYTFEANNATSNRNMGFRFESHPRLNLTGNSAYFNNGVGFFFDLSDPMFGNGTFFNNTAFNNSASGFSFVAYSAHPTVPLRFINNTANNNLGSGFALSNLNNTAYNNTANNNTGFGFQINGGNSTLIDNIAKDNRIYDLMVYEDNPDYYGDCANTIQNTLGSGDRSIVYLKSGTTYGNATISELLLCNADNANIANVTVLGSDSYRNNGMILVGTDFASITNSSSVENLVGIDMGYVVGMPPMNNSITGNNFTNDTYGVYIVDYGSSANNFTSNLITGNNFGVMINQTGSSNAFQSNVISNSSSAGFYLRGNATMAKDRLYNNTRDLWVMNLGAAMNLSLANVIFDGPLGALSNYTNISANYNSSSSQQFVMNWTSQPAALPAKRFSVNGKYLNISALSGSPTISNLTFYWNDTDAGAPFDESLFELWKYNSSGWTQLSATLNAGANSLSIASIGSFSGFGLLENNASSCKKISVPGEYVLTDNLTGSPIIAPTNVFENATACIWINVSNVLLDCQGYTLTGYLPGGPWNTTNGIVVSDGSIEGPGNITIKNCMITNYTRGMYASVQNSTITNNTAYGNAYLFDWNSYITPYQAPGAGLRVYAYNSTISKNNCSSNNESMWLSLTDSVMAKNTGNGNTLSGFDLSEFSGTVLSNNTACYNGRDGFAPEGDTFNNAYLNNTLCGNQWTGFTTGDHIGVFSNNTFDGNAIFGNGEDGFHWSQEYGGNDMNDNILSNNRVYGNNGSGMYFYADGDKDFNNTIVNNTLYSNLAQIEGGDFMSYMINTTINTTSFNTTSISMSYFRDISINATNSPGAAPTGYTSFHDKYVRIVNNTGVPQTVEEILFHYTDAEASGITEANLRAFRWNGSDWSMLPNQSVNDTGNYIFAANVSDFDAVFGLFIQESAGPDISTCRVLTEPGAYYLTTDLTGAPNDASEIRPGAMACIKIGAPDVDLDCAGFGIDRDGAGGTAIGIALNSSASNVTVMNCGGISNYTYGVFLSSTSGNTLGNNNVTSGDFNQAGIYLDSSANNILESNTLIGLPPITVYPCNYGAGCWQYVCEHYYSEEWYCYHPTLQYYNDSGIVLNSSDGNSLRNNTASLEQYGFWLVSSNNSEVNGNSAFNSSQNGFYLLSSANNTLLGNSANNNSGNSNSYDYGGTAGSGFCLNSSANNTLSGNTAYNNGNNNMGGNGFFLDSSPNNTLSANTANNDGSWSKNGFYLRSSANNTLLGNAAGSNYYAYFISSSANNTLEGNSADGDAWGYYFSSSDLGKLENNTATNGNYGFELYSCGSAMLANNTASGNSEAGFIMSWSDDAIVENNTAFGNGYYGAFEISNSNNAHVENNNATGNPGDYGFSFNNVFGSAVINNHASGNNRGNFYVETSSYNLFENNTAFDSVVGDGFYFVDIGGGGSCPLLYSWNGTGYAFVSDIAAAGKVGFLPMIQTGRKPNPKDYTKIESFQLKPKDGKYTIQTAEEYDEIAYLDEQKLMTVDHPADVDVFTSMNTSELGKVYTVGKSPMHPVSCIDEDGADCLPAILDRDGKYTKETYGQPKTLTLDFGNLSNASEAKLILTYSLISGTVNFPTRIIQVRNASGGWANVSAGSQLRSAGFLQTFVFNLTGKLTYDRSVRLIFPTSVVDYVAIDTTPERGINISTFSPISADLHYRGYSKSTGGAVKDVHYADLFNQTAFSNPTGNFTRYGDVAPLLAAADDMFVIMHHGDEISASYPYEEAQNGTQRDFFVYDWDYYKRFNYINGTSVDPLPFNNMSVYPYPANESYPSDAEHLSYLSTWNTRSYLANGSVGLSFNNLTNNLADGNFLNGFEFGSIDNYLILQNNATNNGQNGFLLMNSDPNTNSFLNNLSRNIASMNELNGFKLETADSNTLEWNNATSNGNDGFLLTDIASGGGPGPIGSYNNLSNNLAANNSMNGFELSTADNDILDSNTALENGVSGIYLNSAFVNLIANNTVQGGRSGQYFASNQYMTYDGTDYNAGGDDGTYFVASDGFTECPVYGQNASLSSCPNFNGTRSLSVVLNEWSPGYYETDIYDVTFPSCDEFYAWYGSEPPVCHYACVLYSPNGVGNDYTLNESCFDALANITPGLEYPPYVRFVSNVSGIIVVNDSEDNLIYNNIFNASIPAIDENGPLNAWNTFQRTGPNIIGGRDIGGNFYSDYTGFDIDGDGIGQTPYEVPDPFGDFSTYDELPLTNTTGSLLCNASVLVPPGDIYSLQNHTFNVTSTVECCGNTTCLDVQAAASYLLHVPVYMSYDYANGMDNIAYADSEVNGLGGGHESACKNETLGQGFERCTNVVDGTGITALSSVDPDAAVEFDPSSFQETLISANYDPSEVGFYTFTRFVIDVSNYTLGSHGSAAFRWRGYTGACRVDIARLFERNNGYLLYAKNSSGDYELLANDTSMLNTRDLNDNATLIGDIDRYINASDGTVEFVVESTYPTWSGGASGKACDGSTVETDYVQLNISTGLFTNASSPISVNPAATPFYSLDPNPASDSCFASMAPGSYCNMSWTINTTGAPYTSWELVSAFNGSNVAELDTGSFNVTITRPELCNASIVIPPGNISVAPNSLFNVTSTVSCCGNSTCGDVEAALSNPSLINATFNVSYNYSDGRGNIVLSDSEVNVLGGGHESSCKNETLGQGFENCVNLVDGSNISTIDATEVQTPPSAFLESLSSHNFGDGNYTFTRFVFNASDHSAGLGEAASFYWRGYTGVCRNIIPYSDPFGEINDGYYIYARNSTGDYELLASDTVPSGRTLSDSVIGISNISNYLNSTDGTVEFVVEAVFPTSFWLYGYCAGSSVETDFVELNLSEEREINGSVPLSMNPSAVPFFTSSQNPIYPANISCLQDLGPGATCNTTWIVNASGSLGDSADFFVLYNNYLETDDVNVTIENTNCPVISAPGNYMQTVNFTGAPNPVSLPEYPTITSACIYITVPDVEFDCNGSTLKGSGASGSIGVLLDPALPNVTIRNCNVSGYETGVFSAESSDDSFFNDISWNNTENGFILREANQFLISENIAYNNSQGGFVFLDVTHSSITDNYAHQNGFAGFSISSINTSQLLRNHAENNTAEGFTFLGEVNGNDISSNTAYNNSDGFKFQGDSRSGAYVYDNNINGNTAWSNAMSGFSMLENTENNSLEADLAYLNNGDGFLMDGDRSNNITNSTSHSNIQSGFELWGSVADFVSNNTAYNDSESGLYAHGGSGNAITRNIFFNDSSRGIWLDQELDATISSNAAYNNSQSGITVMGYSDNCLIANNTAFNNTFHGFQIESTSYAYLYNNTASENLWRGFHIFNANNVTGRNNTAFSNQRYGVHLYFDYNTTLADTTLYGNTMAGLYMWDANLTSIDGAVLFNNGKDVLVNNDRPTPVDFSMSHVTITNPSGSLANFTNLSLNDSVESGASYSINWTINESALPKDMLSFAQKYVNISTIAGSPSIDSSTWSWDDSELGSAFNESRFELWKYEESGWTQLNASLDTATNTLNIQDLMPGSGYGIFENNASSNCPVITSPGTYVQDINYTGSPNDAGPLADFTCVKIASSDVVFDCDGFSITGTSGATVGNTTYGILLNGSLTNVTIRDCPGITNYTDGVYIYQSNSSVIQNTTSSLNGLAGFFVDGGYENNLTNDLGNGNGGLMPNSGYGFFITGGSRNLISGSAASDDYEGFRIYLSSQNNLTSSFAHDNTFGFAIINSTGNLLLGDLASNNTGAMQSSGFYIVNSTGNNLTRNLATENNGLGYYIYNSGSNSFTENNASFQTSLPAIGFDIESSNLNTFTGNNAFNNSMYGFSLYGGSNNVLSGNNASNNSGGFDISSDSGNNFTSNNAFSNADSGFGVSSSANDLFSGNNASFNLEGFYLVSAQGCSLGSNAAFNNSDEGYYLENSSSNTLTSNRAYNNTDSGFYFTASSPGETSSGNSLSGNYAYENQNDGFILYFNPSGNNLTLNTAYNNGNNGFTLSLGADSNSLVSNNAYGNYMAGYFVSQSNGNNLTNNSATAHPYNMLQLGGAGFVLQNSGTTRLVNNTASGNGRGFVLHTAASGNLLQGNNVSNNTDTGIQILAAASSNNLTGNLVYNNSYGISITGNHTRLDGNTVFNSSGIGTYVVGANDTYISADRFYSNHPDFEVQETVGGYTFNLSSVIFDNPLGSLTNYTNLSINDSMGSGEAYSINWSSNSTALPSNLTSFRGKYANISTISGSVSIDAIVWSWLDSESSGYNESKLELWKYNSTGWSLLNRSASTASNTLSLFSMEPGSDYGILSDEAGPDIVWISQLPSDINSFNLLAIQGNITYNITDPSGVNLSSIYLYYKTNSSTSDCMAFVNGSSGSCGYQNETYFANGTNNYSFSIFDGLVYPATYNLPERPLELTPHVITQLSDAGQYAKIQLLNVSGSKNYSFFEVMVNRSQASSQPVRFYYCNSSYTTGNPTASNNCALFGTLAASVPYNHTHSSYSSHHVIPMPINATSGTVGTVKVTSTSYFLVRGANNGWDLHYVSNVSRVGELAKSTDSGNTYSNIVGTADAHLHQYDGSDTFYYYACASDNLWNSNCSSVRSDLIDLGGMPPSAPDVFNPTNGTYCGNITINYTAAASPNGYNISHYNISLLNNDSTFNKTIIGNNSLNLSYVWNTVGTAPANYTIRVEACDVNGLCSFGYSEDFNFTGSTCGLGNCPVITSPGKYNMTMNNTGAPNDASEMGAGSYACVKIASSNVTFDCAGYYVTGNGTSGTSQYGILTNGSITNITVMNCPGVRNYTYGIYAHLTNNSVIANCTAGNNSIFGITLYGSSFFNLSSNTAFNNLNDAFQIVYGSTIKMENNTAYGNSAGFVFYNISNGNVTNNTAFNNTINGFQTQYFYSSSMTNNNAFNNSNDGFVMADASSNNNVSNNKATNNSQNGFYVSYSNNNTYAWNNASNNLNDGLQLAYCNASNMTSNTANNNVIQGMELNYASSGSMTNNTANNNAQNGFVFQYSSGTVINSNNATNSGNTGYVLISTNSSNFTNNVAANGQSGFYMITSNNNRFTGNNATNSTVYHGFGLDIGCNYNIFTNNVADFSNITGFTVSQGNYNSFIGNNATNSRTLNGFSVGSSSYNNFTNNLATNNGADGFGLESSAFNNLSGNTAFNNTNNGFYAHSSGNNTFNANNASFTRTYNGFTLDSSTSTNLSNNRAFNNTLSGFTMQSGANGNILTDNSAYNNTQSGYYLISINNSRLTGNNATYNGVFGFQISTSSYYNNLSGNIASQNKGNHGFQIDTNSSYNLLNNNTAFNNTDGTTFRIGFNIVTNAPYNTLVNNTAAFNRIGFQVNANSNYNNLTGNIAYNSTQLGFNVQSSSNNTLANNSAFNNTQIGFQLTTGANSNNLTGNNATSNALYGFQLITNSFYNLLANNSASDTTTNDGFRVNSNSNELYGNNASRNRYGFNLDTVSNITLTNNNALSNRAYGIRLTSNSNDTLSFNNATNNTNVSFYIDLSSYINFTSNFASYPAATVDSVRFLNSNYNVISNNTVTGSTANGIRLDNTSYSNLTGNNVTNSTSHGFRFLARSSNNNYVNNSASFNALNGFSNDAGLYCLFANNTGSSNRNNGLQFGPNSNHSIAINNTAYNNSLSGYYILDTVNLTIAGGHLYSNGLDMRVNSTLATFNSSLNVTGLIFDSPAGLYQNYTDLSLNDTILTNTGFGMNWTANESVLPSNMLSFAQKFINISALNGSISLDWITWSWLDTELTGYNESKFELWKYNSSGWVNMNAGLDTTANMLNLTNFVPGSDYGIFENNASANCPIITSPGIYTQDINYTGAPNSASPLAGLACVKIASSNVVFDCAGFNITNNGTAGTTYGILTNGTPSNPLHNITIRGCAISNYSNGAYLASTDNSSFDNNTAFGDSSYGIMLDLSSMVNVTGNTLFNSGTNLHLYGGSNNTVANNIAYGSASHGFILSSDYCLISNNNVSGSGNDAMYFMQSDHCNVSGNLVFNNTAHGFNFYLTPRTMVSDNIAFNNSIGYTIWESATLVNNTAFNNSYSCFSSTESNINLTGNRAYDCTAYGFFFEGSTNATLSNNIANGNGQGITVAPYFGSPASNITLSNNSASNSTYDGFHVSGVNISLLSNGAYNNSQEGFHLMNATASTLLSNIASNNSFAGFRLDTGGSNNLSGNTASNNTFYGFLVESDLNILANNTARDNLDIGLTGAGFYMNGSSGNNLSGNNATNNPHGFKVESGNSNSLLGNNASANSYTGFLLRNTSLDVLTNNTATGSADGFYLSTASVSNTLTNNSASLNSVNGFHLYSGAGDTVSNLLQNNTAFSNNFGFTMDGSTSTALSPHLNLVANNTAYQNSVGYYLLYSSENNYTSNIARNNTYGFKTYFAWSENMSQNDVYNNTQSGFYLESSGSNMNITNNTVHENPSGIYLISSGSNNIVNNTVYANNYGVYIFTASQFNQFTGNNVSFDNFGFMLMSGAANNTFSNNTACNELADAGFYLNTGSGSNTFAGNYVCNDNKGFYSVSTTGNSFNANILNNDSTGFHMDTGSNFNSLTSNLVTNSSGAAIQMVASLSNNLTYNWVNKSGSGITLSQQSAQNRLVNNTVNNISSDGISLQNSSSNTLSGNQVFSNSGDGIRVALLSNTNNISENSMRNNQNGNGLTLNNVSGNTVRNNTMANNVKSGINIQNNARNNPVSWNNVTRNGQVGILVDGSPLNVLSNNTITNNNPTNQTLFGIMLGGIALYGGANNVTLTNNTLINNSQYGIGILSSDYALATGNIITQNQLGYFMNNSNNGRFRNDTIANNTEYGIFMQDNNNTRVNGGTFVNNSYGVYLNNSDAANISSNNITNNSISGIRMDAASEAGLLDSDYVCYNGLDISNQGSPNTGSADRCDSFLNWSENSHLGCEFSCSSMWHRFFGNVNGTLVLRDNTSSNLFFGWNATGFNIYFTDYDSKIDWNSLQAIGQTSSNTSSSDDFTELDTAFNTTAYGDNINRTYSTDGSAPISTQSFTVFGNPINLVPVANSTASNTTFRTGILWDMSNGTEYSNSFNQSTVWVVKVNASTPDVYGTYDYLIQVPYTLSTREGSNDVVAVYLELQ